MKKVIFICRANIFRSQVAKGFYNKFAEGASFAESYGTRVDEDGFKNAPISQFPGMSETIEILKTEGVDISNEYCKQITPEKILNSSKVIVMAEKDSIPGWLKEGDYEYWDVPNPASYTSETAFNTINLIRQKVKELVQTSIG